MAFLGLLLATTLASRSDVTAGGPPVDFLRANMDFAVDPGVDFFEYANGTWLKKHPIPPSESSWGIGSAVEEDLLARLRTISEESAGRRATLGSDEQKVGDFWATAMDQGKANKLGVSPLTPLLSKIDAIDSVQGAVSMAFDLQRTGVSTFFRFGIEQDERDSDVMAVHLEQGGLGLPNRDFYFNTEAGVAKIRDAYIKHVQKVLELSGLSDAQPAAVNVVALETALAKNSRKLAELRDPEKNYNKMLIEEAEQKLTPSIVWSDHFKAWGLEARSVVVGQPEFFSGLETLLRITPVSTLKNYIRFHVVNRALPYLNDAADLLDFQFGHQVLSGQKTPRPRWKRVIDSENRAIGFVLGRAFVKECFPESAKQRYSNLVESIRSVFRDRIDRLTWMSAATKAQAHVKLAALTKKVGFPDHWKDYSALKIGRASYYENMVNASMWEFDDQLAKFGKPVDRTEWDITPQTFNAYYNPSNNEIVLPAAAFALPGLKDSEIDDAVIYGNAGGSWIGHEMTHGFDDEGRQFDAKGNLKEWWTDEDAKKFKERADVMAKQFDAYEPIPGIHINGEASLGENIADFGGVLLGLEAFKKTDTYKAGKQIGGLTPVQRYFLAYALSWMDEEREQRLRRNLLSDVHAPAKWRVIGPLSNIPDFFEAFGIKPGQPMRRPDDQLVHIW